MRHTILLAATYLIAISACTKTNTQNIVDIQPPFDGYELLWNDEFNGDAIDTNNWNIEENNWGGGNSELQYYTPQNASIGIEPQSGKQCLLITAKNSPLNGRSATSARLNTQGKHEFRYGIIEASIKLPSTANGLWPAFWMLGFDNPEVGWPASGEIDIMEMGATKGIQNGIQNRLFNGACHWGRDWNNGNAPSYAADSIAPYSLQGEFHTYTMLWTPDSICMYLDHKTERPYFALNISDCSNDFAPGVYFNKPFYILVNMAVGGNYTGIWDIDKITALSSGKATMYVDYVRVFTKSNNK